MSNILKISPEQKKEIEKLKSLGLMKPRLLISIIENNIFDLLSKNFSKKQILLLIENELGLKLNYPHFTNILKTLAEERKNISSFVDEINSTKKDEYEDEDEEKTDVKKDDDDDDNLAIDLFANIRKFQK